MFLELVFLTTVGGIMSLVGGVGVLVFEKQIQRYVLEMISFAAGVMLTVATLDLLPESLSSGTAQQVSNWIFAGILFLFILERTTLWFHHHHDSHESKINIFSIWIGDTFHNLIDGVAIAATYLINPSLGIATTLAVAAHELPQEIADFSIYLAAKVSKTKTLLLNFLSSLATVLGATGVYFLRDTVSGITGNLLAFTAGMFMYIALADLIPELHQRHGREKMLRQSIAFGLGVVAIFVMGMFVKD